MAKEKRNLICVHISVTSTFSEDGMVTRHVVGMIAFVKDSLPTDIRPLVRRFMPDLPERYRRVSQNIEVDRLKHEVHFEVWDEEIAHPDDGQD